MRVLSFGVLLSLPSRTPTPGLEGSNSKVARSLPTITRVATKVQRKFQSEYQGCLDISGDFLHQVVKHLGPEWTCEWQVVEVAEILLPAVRLLLEEESWQATSLSSASFLFCISFLGLPIPSKVPSGASQIV